MSTEGSPVADHPSIDDLADAAEGLLDPGRSREVAEHVPGCPTCQQTVAALGQVSRTLAAAPDAPMPPAVAARLAATVAAESAHRSTVSVPAAARTVRPRRYSLGHFDDHVPHLPWWRRLAPALGVVVAAAAVGLGGYVLSAAAGLNEPPLVAAAVSTEDLATSARAVQTARDLDPHRFSAAWFCGRSVTDGRITGLVRARVDGTPALLVYTRDDGSAVVTVVTGCTTRVPAPTASAVLGR
jgi:anti-sigma factor RsiW